MMFRPSRLMTALVLAASMAAQAATYDLHLPLDASQLKPGLLSGGDAAGTVTLRPGDTLAVEIAFLPGQRLEVNQPLSFAVVTASTDLGASIDFDLVNSLTLRGAQGQALLQGTATQTANGNALQALFFGSQLGVPMTGSLSLTGLSFTMTVQSYGDGATSHTFAGPQLAIIAGGLSSSVSPVPEPGSGALTFVGLGALGLWFARRKLAARRG